MHFSVVRWGEMFCEVFPVVLIAWAYDYAPLTLRCSVSEPVKSHVDCFGRCLMVSLRIPSAHLLSV